MDIMDMMDMMDALMVRWTSFGDGDGYDGWTG